MLRRVGTLFGAFLVMLVGCADARVDETRSAAARGLDRADGAYGSCEAATCGEAAAFGNCWCDEACAEWGDCCADKVDACGGASMSEPVTALCAEASDCATGLTCDTSVCMSACRDGDDCEDACLGACVEPMTQPLPTPQGDAPGSDDDDVDDDDDDDDDDDEGDDDRDVPECDCPEGELCVPLCPVCPDEVPEELCPCGLVCVAL